MQDRPFDKGIVRENISRLLLLFQEILSDAKKKEGEQRETKPVRFGFFEAIYSKKGTGTRSRDETKLGFMYGAVQHSVGKLRVNRLSAGRTFMNRGFNLVLTFAFWGALFAIQGWHCPDEARADFLHLSISSPSCIVSTCHDTSYYTNITTAANGTFGSIFTAETAGRFQSEWMFSFKEQAFSKASHA